ncbi:hypothetical protein HCJ76_43800 [Streptomyces sp. MC1]|uniref:hypothetical protein n=1 Tax=Streptomyces sp. MC1 TaxID=295105 RepID=UPI0018C8F207|nr:hypothetical protein [Streptomyces sp. MC1]MBG7704807.1 hypothetical protein [Streptomyces sp. MC1]
MNPPTQSPPLPSHRAPRRRLARDLIGLFLVGVGTVGLLGALYVGSPTFALFLIGLVAVTAGAAVLQTEPPVPRPVRLAGGYGALCAGLTLIAAVAYSLNPWSLLFGALLAVAVWVCGGEE